MLKLIELTLKYCTFNTKPSSKMFFSTRISTSATLQKEQVFQVTIAMS